MVLLVLCPAGSITAFQHHVTRSLRRFHVGSPGSSPCWLDHCVSTPCDSITGPVQCYISCVYSFVGSVLFVSSPFHLYPWIFLGVLQFSVLIQCSSVLCPAGLITAFQHYVTRSLRRFHVGSPGSSSCWLDNCVLIPCVPRWFSWFFALLARSLRLNTL